MLSSQQKKQKEPIEYEKKWSNDGVEWPNEGYEGTKEMKVNTPK